MTTGGEDTSHYSEMTPPEIWPAETVEDPDLAFMLGYWTELKGTRIMPNRSDVAARKIGHRSRVVHLYDVLEGGVEFRFRRVGAGVFADICPEQTGRLVSEHPDPGVRFRFGMMLSHIVGTREPARSLSVRLTGDMLRNQYAEVLWLPLGSGEQVEQVLAISSLKLVSPGTTAFGRSMGSR